MNSPSLITRWRAMPARTRWAAVAIALVIAAGVTWAVVAMRNDARTAQQQPPRAKDGMEGMAGMDMSTEGSMRLTASQIAHDSSHGNAKYKVKYPCSGRTASKCSNSTGERSTSPVRYLMSKKERTTHPSSTGTIFQFASIARTRSITNAAET